MDWRDLFPNGIVQCEQYFGALPANTCNVAQGLVMVGVTPGGSPVCQPIQNALTPQVLNQVLPRLTLNPSSGTYHCTVTNGQCTRTVNAQICTLANVETNDRDTRFRCRIGSDGGTCRAGERASGIDCQVFGGNGSWQLMGSGRGLRDSSGICSMTCFNFQAR